MNLLMTILPPPVYGASVINEKLSAAICAESNNNDVVNIVPSSLSEHFGGRFWKIARFFYCLKLAFKIWAEGKKYNHVLLTVSGGIGLLIDLVFVVAIHGKYNKIYIHHHNYSLFLKKRLIFGFIVRMVGKRLVNVFLCEKMRDDFHKIYGHASGKCFVVSNAAFFDFFENQVRNNYSGVVGFISNVTFDKGIREFVDLVLELREVGYVSKAVIAGPLMGGDVESFVVDVIRNYPDLFECVGRVSGVEKELFYKKIDVLIFPTSYINEAEPLIIYEAASHGVPTISTRRGCIPSILKNSGLVFDGKNSNDVLTYFENLNVKNDFYKYESSRAGDALIKARLDAACHLSNLIREFCDV